MQSLELFRVNFLLKLFPNWWLIAFFVHILFNLYQEMLLWSEDRSRSAKPYPSDESCSRKLVMLHGIASNQTPRSSQAGFTMNCHCSFCWFNNLQKFLDNLQRWWRTISEKEVIMINAVLCKILAVISGRVKTDDSFHAEFLENG